MPGAESRQPAWQSVLDAAIQYHLRSVHTALPGTITAYDEATQTATVELAVHLETTPDEFAEVAPLIGVPVVWPGAWADGDKCLVVFSEEDPSKWWETNGASVEPPAVLTRHGFAGPLCIPIVAEAGDAVDFVALASPVEAQLEDLKSAINGWVPVPNDGGAALKTALTAWLASSSVVGSVKVKAR